MQKSVVIVGAGPSGLVCAKEMLEAGFQVTTIEMSDGVGGVFRLQNNETYDNLYLTVSNVYMSFSDWPMKCASEGKIWYPNKEVYGQYLNDYADHFKVRDTIMFRTEVKKAALDAKGRWNVVVKSLDSGKETTLDVDVLLVATGCHATPKVPDFAGYTGRVRHAKQFKDAKDLGDKRVLVVGGNESAADVAAEVANDARTAYGWVRQRPACAPRFKGDYAVRGKIYDEYAILKAEKPGKVCNFLESSVITRFQNMLPSGFYGGMRQLMWRGSQFRLISRWQIQENTVDFWRAEQVHVPNKSDRFTHAVEIGKLNCIVAPTVTCKGKEITFNKATFANFKDCKEQDVTFEVDEIVCATGFKNDFTWLEADVEWNARAWYKHCFPTNPELQGKLMFIGWCRPHSGGIPQCAEIAARLSALVIKGERTLPKNIAELTKKERMDEDRHYHQSPQYDNLMDYMSYMESVADLIGCVPSEPNILTQPSRWLKYWFFPNWSCYYRLTGPGANPEQAYKVIDAFGFFKHRGAPLKLVPVQVIMSGVFMVQMCINTLLLCCPVNMALNTPGYNGVYFKSKCTVLHGNKLKAKHISKPLMLLATTVLVGAFMRTFQVSLPSRAM